MMDSVNDNVAETVLFEAKTGGDVRIIEYRPKHVTFYLHDNVEWESLVEGITDPRFLLPSADKLAVATGEGSLQFAKQNGQPFFYEDVKLLVQVTRVYQLIDQAFSQQLITGAKRFYTAHYTLDNPDPDTALKEITVRSGLHFYFLLPLGESITSYQEGKFYETMLSLSKEEELGAQVAAGEDELHVTGDSVNRHVIEKVLAILSSYGLLPASEQLVLEEKILQAHVKDVAGRELEVLTLSMKPEEGEELAPYREILMLLAETGQFKTLMRAQLEQLRTLHTNRKAVYQLPLVVRIPLRSIYICFHEEISRVLGMV